MKTEIQMGGCASKNRIHRDEEPEHKIPVVVNTV